MRTGKETNIKKQQNDSKYYNLSIIILNVNVLNSPNKRHRLVGWIKI
jgi:hypothetical protein